MKPVNSNLAAAFPTKVLSPLVLELAKPRAVIAVPLKDWEPEDFKGVPAGKTTEEIYNHLCEEDDGYLNQG